MYAQNAFGNISGYIVNKNGTPINAVNIQLGNTGSGTSSNAEGYFSIKNIQVGDHELLISCIGYESLRYPISVKKGQNTMTIPLIKANMQLEGVEIVAETKSTKKRNEPFAVNVISTEGIKTQSIQLNDILDQSVGMRVRQEGGLGSRATYSINGLTGNAVRIFLDGIPMEYFDSAYSLVNMPVATIKRIDIYKGVVPIELGNDALGGAINVVTHSINDNTLDASYSYGSFNTHQFNINGNLQNETNGLTLKLNSFYNYSDNNYKVWGDDIYVSNDDINDLPNFGKITHGITVERFHDSYKNVGTKADVGVVNKKWADQCFIGVLYSDKEKDIQHGATMHMPFGERRVAEDVFMPNITYKHNNFLTKRLKVNAFLAYVDENRKVIDTSSNQYNWYGKVKREPFPIPGEATTTPSLLKSDEQSYLGRLNTVYKLDEQHAFGVNYLVSRFKRINDDPLALPERRTYGDVRKMTKTFLGATYQNQLWDGKLKTALFFKYFRTGVDVVNSKYDPPNYVLNALSSTVSQSGYGLGMSYMLFDGVKLIFSAEQAVRLPEPDEIFGNGADNVVPNYTLQPESSTNMNIGFKYSHTNDRHLWSIYPTFFYRNTKDLIQQSTSNIAFTTVDDFQFQNVSKTKNIGVDAELNYEYNKQLKVSVNGSYLDARFNSEFNEDGERVEYFGERLKNTPYLQFGSVVNYSKSDFFQLKSRFNLYVSANYVHEFYRFYKIIGSQGKEIIPAQFISNLGASYTFPNQNITLGIDVRNLFNEQAFDNFAIQKPGRALFFKTTYHLGKPK